ncbi:MAG: FISUMP domain-containing protein [Bacteroidales bacterium]|nr:FISUMP domain-containing protein [Bacteroidales bacterium]
MPLFLTAQNAVTKQGESTSSGTGYVDHNGRIVGYTALTKQGEILFPCETPFTDSRDGNVYPIVRIGNQCWMAENLKFLPEVVGPPTNSSGIKYYYVYDYNGTDVSIAKSTPEYALYGVQYNFIAATDGNFTGSSSNPSGIKGACPSGWHLPSDSEWKELTDYLSSNPQYWCGGNSSNTAKSLANTFGWLTSPTSCHVGNDQTSNNTASFNGLPGGYYNTASFTFKENSALWWSATQQSPTLSYLRRMYYNGASPVAAIIQKSYGLSVRCIRNDCEYLPPPTSATHTTTPTSIIWNWSAIPHATGYKYNTTNNYSTAIDIGNVTSFTQSVTNGTCGEFTLYVWAYSQCALSEVGILKEYNYITDARDGNQYKTVQIGSQCWMKENLKYAASGSWCYDNNVSNCITYGRLYDWATLMNGFLSSSSNPSGVQGLCPSGWHLPSDAEWTQLTDYLSANSTYWCGVVSTQIAKALANTSGWANSGISCHVGNSQTFNNSSQFTALPSGKRQYIITPPYYSYNSINSFCQWFSSTENVSAAWTRALNSTYESVYRWAEDKQNGFSARCVKN